MGSSLDGLIRSLIDEVALSGPAGASPAEILHFLDEYQASQRNHNASLEGPSGGDDLLEHKLDRPYQEQVWKWLTRHPEIRIGLNGEGNQLSLAEVEAHNERHRRLPEGVEFETPRESPTQFCEENGSVHLRAKAHESIAGSYQHGAIKEPSKGGGNSAGGTATANTSLHVFTSEERMWYAVAGHGPDFDRIPKSEFACLAVIAAHRKRGIVQTELVRVTGQDKRSLPVRTQSLADKGYIVKKHVLVPGSRTSLCILKRFASQHTWHPDVLDDNTQDQGNPGKEPAPEKVRRHIYEGMEPKIRQIFNIVKELGIITWNDLKRKLDVWQQPKQAKTLAVSVRRLERFGFLQRVMAAETVPQPHRTLFRSVKLIREPTEEEWTLFFQAGSEASTLAMFSQQKYNNSKDSESDSDTEEDYQIDETIQRQLQDSGSAVIDPLELEEMPLLWTPDLPLTNTLHDAIQSSGSKGMSIKDLRDKVFGCFFHRPIEHQLGRLVGLWQASQPLHLRHLAIVRDTGITGKTAQYVHYTYDIYKSLVASGNATWEAIEVLKVENNRDRCHDIGIDAVPTLDGYGFPILDESRFEGSGNTASLKDCVGGIAAKMLLGRRAAAIGRLEALPMGRPKGSLTVKPKVVKISGPEKPKGRPPKHWRPGVSENLSNLSSAKAKSILHSRKVALKYQRRKAEDEVAGLLGGGQEEVDARVGVMLKYVAILKAKELSKNAATVLEALRARGSLGSLENPPAKALDNSQALNITDVMSLWESLFSAKDDIMPENVPKRRGRQSKPVQSTLGYWPSVASHSILIDAPKCRAKAPSQKGKGAWKKRVLTIETSKSNTNSKDPSVHQVHFSPKIDTIEVQTPPVEASSLVAGSWKRDADSQMVSSSEVASTKRRGRIPKANHKSSFITSSSSNVAAHDDSPAAARTGQLREIQEQPEAIKHAPRSTRPVRTRQKSVKVLESEYFDHTIVHTSPMTTSENQPPRLTYPEQMKAIKRTGTGIFVGHLALLPGATHSVRPLESQMLVFKLARLKDMPWFKPDQCPKITAKSLPGFPSTSLEALLLPNASMATSKTYKSPYDQGNSPERTKSSAPDAQSASVIKDQLTPQQKSPLVSEKINDVVSPYQQQKASDSTMYHRQSVTPDASSYLNGKAGDEAYDQQTQSGKDFAPDAASDSHLVLLEVDLQDKHDPPSITEAPTPNISTIHEEGLHSVGGISSRHSLSPIRIRQPSEVDCLPMEVTDSQLTTCSFIEECSDVIERGSKVLNVISALQEASEVTSSAKNQNNRGVDKSQDVTAEEAIQERDAGSDIPSMQIDDNPNKFLDGMASGNKVVVKERTSSRSTNSDLHTVTKIKPTDGSVAALRKSIALEIIETCGGIFPGDHEIVKPFDIIWKLRTKAGSSDRRTVQNVIKALIDSNKLRKLKFTFKNKNDVPVTKSIVTLSCIDPNDIRVLEMQSKIIESGTQLYIPEAVVRLYGPHGISSAQAGSENQPQSRKKSEKSVAKLTPLPGQWQLPIVDDAVQLQNPRPMVKRRPRLPGVTLEERRRRRENALIQKPEEKWQAAFAVQGYQPSRTSLESEAAGTSEFLFWPHTAEVSENNSGGTITRMIQPKGRLMKLVTTPASSLVTRIGHRAYKSRADWPASRLEPSGTGGKEQRKPQVTFTEPLGLGSRFNYPSSSESEASGLVNRDFARLNKTPTASSRLRNSRSNKRKSLERQLQEIAIEYSMCIPTKMRYQKSTRMQLRLGSEFATAAKLDADSARWNLLSIMDPVHTFHMSSGTFAAGFASQYMPSLTKSGTNLKVNKQPQKLGFEASWRQLSYLMNPRQDFHAPSGTFSVEFGANNTLTRRPTSKRYQVLGSKRRKINPGTASGNHWSLLNPKHSFHTPTGTFSIGFVGDVQGLIKETSTHFHEAVLPNDLEDLLSQSHYAELKSPPDSWHVEADTVLDQINRIEKWELATRNLAYTQSENWRFINLHLQKPFRAASDNSERVQFQENQLPRRELLQVSTQKPGKELLSQALELKRRRIADSEGRPFKRVRLRGPKYGKILGPEGDRRILTAVIVVRTLTGGVEQNIDWVLLSHIFDFQYSERLIHQRWAYVYQRFKSTVEKFQANFQERFLQAYEKGVVPSLNYEKLEEYDWNWLIDWALEAFKDPKSISSVPELPSQKMILDDHFDLTEAYENDIEEYYEMDRPQSMPRRHTVIHRDPHAIHHSPPCNAQPRVEGEIPDIARSWVLANIVTPDQTYSAEFARQKLLFLGEDQIENVVRDLLLMKVIAQKNKGRLVPGRDYDISEHFLSRLRRTFPVQHFKQAVTYKRYLDQEFESKRPVLYKRNAPNPDTMVALNLIASRRIKLTAVNPPMDKMGMFETAYVTRNLNKKRFEFEMEMTPTAAYLAGNPLLPLPPPPGPFLNSTQTNIDPHLRSRAIDLGVLVKYPVWRDINLDLVPVMWDLVLAAVLSIMSVQSGVNAEGIEKCLRPSLQLWEIRSMMQWCVDAGVGTWNDETRKGTGHGSVKLGEWWWMALGNEPGAPV